MDLGARHPHPPQGQHLHRPQQQSNLPAPAEPGQLPPAAWFKSILQQRNGLFEVTIKPIETSVKRARLAQSSRSTGTSTTWTRDYKDSTFTIISSSPTCPPQLSLESYLLLPGLGPFCNKLNGPFEVTIKPIDTSCRERS